MLIWLVLLILEGSSSQQDRMLELQLLVAHQIGVIMDSSGILLASNV